MRSMVLVSQSLRAASEVGSTEAYSSVSSSTSGSATPIGWSRSAAWATTALGRARQSHFCGSIRSFQLSWKFQKSMKTRTRTADLPNPEFPDTDEGIQYGGPMRAPGDYMHAHPATSAYVGIEWARQQAYQRQYTRQSVERK